MSQLSKGWNAFHRGQFQQAFEYGDQTNSSGGLILKALSLQQDGRGDQAISLVETQLSRSPSATLEALLGDLLGRKGQRKQAERRLQRAVKRDPEQGLFRSLLGEQRIRQGRWKPGTKDITEALNQDRDRAFPHIQKVVTDMVDAVVARRIPRPDAMKFINRVDYSTADKTGAMNSFFATARRSLNSQTRMDRSSLVEPWSQVSAPGEVSPSATSSPATASPTRSAPSQKPPSSASTPPPQRSTSSPRSSQRPSPSSPPTAPRESSRRSSSPQKQRLRQRPNANRPSDDEPNISANQKNMTVVMQQERQKNESLQELIAPVYPPTWPSELEDPIDVIDAIGFSDTNLLRGSNSIETANFRITGGEIRVQITLDRCMNNLITAAQKVSPTTLPMTPASIPRIELNLIDRFHEEMDDLQDIYLRESEVENPHALAVGKFIGECIVQSYGGIWDHALPAHDTQIQLGDHRLDPIGLATKFLDTPSFDAVDLSTLIDQAREAISTSTAFPTFADHIDPTSGLEGVALQMSLAELWIAYRFQLQETQTQAVANSIKIRDTDFEEVILFSIDAQYISTSLLKGIDGSIDGQRRTRMAYVRKDGRFLVLPSNKHFIRVFRILFGELRSDNASTVANWIGALFRPGWHVLTDKSKTKKWQEKTGHADLQAPTFEVHQSGASTLTLHGVDPRGQHRIIEFSTDGHTAEISAH